MAVLAEAGADVLALETVPDVVEAEAMLIALSGLGVPAWLSYTIDGDQTRAGQLLADAFALTDNHDEVLAVGVNCCAPDDVSAAIGVAASASGGKAVVAYPNSGEVWDAVGRVWTGQPVLTEQPLDAWIHDGARLVGGCCRVTPTQIRDLALRLRVPPP
jgi:homocysteine S-methyltransferase